MTCRHKSRGNVVSFGVDQTVLQCNLLIRLRKFVCTWEKTQRVTDAARTGSSCEAASPAESLLLWKHMCEQKLQRKRGPDFSRNPTAFESGCYFWMTMSDARTLLYGYRSLLPGRGWRWDDAEQVVRMCPELSLKNEGIAAEHNCGSKG